MTDDAIRSREFHNSCGRDGSGYATPRACLSVATWSMLTPSLRIISPNQTVERGKWNVQDSEPIHPFRMQCFTFHFPLSTFRALFYEMFFHQPHELLGPLVELRFILALDHDPEKRFCPGVTDEGPSGGTQGFLDGLNRFFDLRNFSQILLLCDFPRCRGPEGSGPSPASTPPAIFLRFIIDRT